MNVDGVSNGIVIDHIRAGRSMDIYHYLHLDKVDSCVAIIKNVQSSKYGRKDIIKIDEMIDLDLDVLGYLDPNITVNIVKNGKLEEKKHLALPEILTNVINARIPGASPPRSRRLTMSSAWQTGRTAFTAVCTARPRPKAGNKLPGELYSFWQTLWRRIGIDADAVKC